MDVLEISLEELTTIVSYMGADGNAVSSDTADIPVNYPGVVLITTLLGGTRVIDNDDTVEYPRIGFYPQTADYSITAVDVDENPVELSEKTYIDAYGRLHLGPEVKMGMLLTITSKYWAINPSTGDGWDLTGTCYINFVEPEVYGNQNAVNEWPYLFYIPVTMAAPASGEFGFTGAGDK